MRKKTTGITNAARNTKEQAAETINFIKSQKIQKMRKSKETANSSRSQKKRASTKVTPSLRVIPPLPVQKVKKLDPRPRMNRAAISQLLSEVHNKCEGSKMIDGFEENIIGYDYSSNAIIYDGDQMLNHLAEDYMVEDIEEGIQIDDRWEYHRIASEYLSFNLSRAINSLPLDPDKPRPIILMRFGK